MEKDKKQGLIRWIKFFEERGNQVGAEELKKKLAKLSFARN